MKRGIGVIVLGLSFTTSAAGQNSYYRFEEGAAGMPAVGTGSIIDSIDGSHDGTPVGGPLYSADVPFAVVPHTQQANTLSLSFDGTQEVLIAAPFVLHSNHDATFEFFIKATFQGHHSIFWTRPDNFDANRYNIYLTGTVFGLDYRDPNGNLRPNMLDGGIADSLWTHLAVTRDASAPGEHFYRLYINGVLVDTYIDGAPNVPTVTTWTIAGREGFKFVGLIDEVRLTDRVLDPSEFLTAASFCARADLNCDGATDGADIQAFVGVLAGESPCQPQGGDVSNDGSVTEADIPGFVACLLRS